MLGVKSEIQAIPRELVGKNIEFNSFFEQKFAYFDIYGFRYSDDYLRELNKMYPLQDLIEEEKRIHIRRHNQDVLELYVLDEATRFAQENVNHKKESKLRMILYNSAVADSWQPIIAKPFLFMGMSDINGVNRRFSVPGTRFDMYGSNDIFSLASLVNRGFCSMINYEGKIVAVPTQKLIEYFIENSSL